MVFNRYNNGLIHLVANNLTSTGFSKISFHVLYSPFEFWPSMATIYKLTHTRVCHAFFNKLQLKLI